MDNAAKSPKKMVFGVLTIILMGQNVLSILRGIEIYFEKKR
jgi:hypothetical protein